MEYIAVIDGGRAPGTKHTTIGGIILKDGNIVEEYSELGTMGSNGDAEWQSLIKCLKLANNYHISSLHINTDAGIIADTLKSEYKILNTLKLQYEISQKDIGLKKAITKRSGNNGCNTSNVFEWIEMNKSSLINTFNHILQKYRTEINILKWWNHTYI